MSYTDVKGLWSIQCKFCDKPHGPVGNLSDFKDSVLKRYYCPKADRTVFLLDDLRYFGECIGTPTNPLKTGFRHAIMAKLGILSERY